MAFQKTSLAAIGGSFVYDVTEDPNAAMLFNPQDPIPMNFARIFGLTGFLINFNTERISYKTEWDGITFTFGFSNINSLKYYSFSFIFFTGSVCSDCTGFPIEYNG